MGCVYAVTKRIRHGWHVVCLFCDEQFAEDVTWCVFML